VLSIKRYSANRVATSPSPLDFLANQQPVYDAMGILMDLLPIISPYVIDFALEILQQSDGRNDVSYNILKLGVAPNGGYASEFGVPILTTSDPNSVYIPNTITTLNHQVLTNAVQMRKNNIYFHTFPLSLRFTKNSIALLSMMSEQITYTCEVQICINTGIRNGDYVVIKEVEEAVQAIDNIRYHWGLNFGSNSSRFSRYPLFETWKAAY